MPVPYTFGTATTSIPLSNLDANFNTPVTIGNTTVGLGNTVTTIGNLTLTNATISTGNVTVTTGIFGAGSNTAPSITTTGDTNTGIFFPAADTIAFTEGGVESMRIDSSGNVGIGQTNPTTKLMINGGTGTSQTRFEVNTTEVQEVATNAAQSAYANRLADAAQHIWKITGSERMRLDSSGNVGIGVSPTVRLQISGADGNALLQINQTVNSNRLQIENNSAAYSYYHEGNIPVRFFTNATERMRIDGSGNVGIGTSSPSTFNSKLAVAGGSGTGAVQFTVSSGGNSGDYGIVSVATSTTIKGRMIADATSGDLRLDTAGSAAGGIGFFTGASYTERMRILATGNILSLAGGSTTATGTGIAFPATQSASSDANTLDDYEEGTWTPSISRASVSPVLSTTVSGNYTKVGNIVTIWGTITINSVTSQGSNLWLVSGMPFNFTGARGSMGGAGNFSATSISTAQLITACGDSLAATTYFYLANADGTAFNSNVQAGTLYITLTYQV